MSTFIKSIFIFYILFNPLKLIANQSLSPGEIEMLHVLNGREIWFQKLGPNYKSLEKCDLGQGVGSLDGVADTFPKFFEDTSKTMTLKERLIYCIKSIQGFSSSSISSNERIQQNIFSILMWLNHINGER